MELTFYLIFAVVGFDNLELLAYVRFELIHRPLPHVARVIWRPVIWPVLRGESRVVAQDEAARCRYNVVRRVQSQQIVY